MKLLIIGGGAIADSNHIPAAKQLLGVENIVLAEPNEIQAHKLKEKHGLLNVVSDYRAVLNDVDACIICTPPHVHNTIIKDCIASNKHILCEKPISDNSEETRKIIMNSDLTLGVCHTYRFFSNRQRVIHLINEGFFGDKYEITIEEGTPSEWPTVSGYCFRKDLVKGGVVFDSGVHSIDFILWCMGIPDTMEYSDDACGGLESNATFKFTRHKCKALFRISRTMDLSNTITIKGNGHTAEFCIFEMNNIKIDGINEVVDKSVKMDWSNVAIYQLQNFLDTIEGKSRIACSIQEGLDVIDIIDKGYKFKKDKYKEKSPNPIGNYKNKKILVTGGTGFIGRNLVERLVIDEGANVRVPIHTWAHAAYISRFDIEMKPANLHSYKDVQSIVEGCEYIFHCVIAYGKDKEETIRMNLEIMENIMKAAKEYNVKHVVFLSSVVVHGENIYGGLSADDPLVSYDDLYADTKLESEKLFWKLSDEYNIPSTVVRPTYVWGPYSMFYTIQKIREMKGGTFCWIDHGENTCNAVYVGNLVDLMLLSGVNESANGQAFIATDGENITWKEFYGYYIDWLGKKASDFCSIPSKEDKFYNFMLSLKVPITGIVDKMWNVSENLKSNNHEFLAKWVILAPRKLIKIFKKYLDRNYGEMSPTLTAIYNYKGMLDVKKNEEVLGYKPRFSVKDGMNETLKYIQQCHW